MATPLLVRINSRCTSCGLCEAACPTRSIFKGEGRYVIDSDSCEASLVCQKVCPANAIETSAAPKFSPSSSDRAPQPETAPSRRGRSSGS